MRLSECSGNEKWLLNMMWAMNFGEVNGVVVSSGNPLKRPKPKFLQTRKCGCPAAKPHDYSDDFDLSEGQLDLILYIRNFRDGMIPWITVKNGLPSEYAKEMEVTAE